MDVYRFLACLMPYVLEPQPRMSQELVRQSCVTTEDLGLTVSSLSDFQERSIAFVWRRQAEIRLNVVNSWLDGASWCYCFVKRSLEHEEGCLKMMFLVLAGRILRTKAMAYGHFQLFWQMTMA